ncbi:MAG: heme o synthase [Phycisphaerales bacterium]
MTDPATTLATAPPASPPATAAATPQAEPKLRLAEPFAPRQPRASARQAAAVIIELGKPRITKLVVMTAAVGFVLGALGQPATWPSLIVAGLGCLIGTALSSAGANALNQCMEVSRDARMVRTAGRPLPSGRLRPAHAWLAGGGMSIAGLLALLILCGPAAAAVSALTIACYLLIYTPMKVLTPLNTWVGAVPGALPPLIGWCAAAWATGTSATTGTAWWLPLTQAGGWSLFALMFVWQIPHFLAIAWMHKDDYARGGYRMLPLNDDSGALTTAHMVAWAALLVPASALPWVAMPGTLSIVYPIIATVTSIAYLALTLWLAASRTRARARTVFLTSIMHLPLLLVALVADGAISAWLASPPPAT